MQFYHIQNSTSIINEIYFCGYCKVYAYIFIITAFKILDKFTGGSCALPNADISLFKALILNMNQYHVII